MFAHDTEPDRTLEPLLRPHEARKPGENGRAVEGFRQVTRHFLGADVVGDVAVVLESRQAEVMQPLRNSPAGMVANEKHIVRRIGVDDFIWRRLVLDVNRPPGHPESILEVSDGTEIPANLGLSEAEKDQRVENLHDPYHDAIGHALAHIWNRGRPPALFSVHSFTPLFGGTIRPWDIGVLWKHDPRLAVPLMEKLRAMGLNVGDNEPYSGLDLAYTIDVHGGAAGLANCVIEINQDQVFTATGIERWSNILIECVGAIMGDERLYRVEKY